jgi:DNA polymerase-3 subunit gamma/tau
MAYQVIARKYRPQRFADVIGQEHVTQTLTNAIAQKRIAHAYLFCGPRGTGKTTIARIFAKCLNATNGPTVDFADDDPKGAEIAEGRSLDVLEIDAASNRGIDEIRGLRDAVRYAPATSRFKVYIIDEVHMLTKEAFNALLKTLEEPPEHVKFMFATTEPEKVLATILSRCQRFDLRRIPTALIVKHIAHIAGLEKVSIDQPALYAIARGADGAMRDAESTLDQLISFCGEKIEESDVLSMFGLTAQAQLLDLSRAILAGEVQTALNQLDQLVRSGKDLGRLLADLLNHFRNLLLFQISKGDLSLLEVSEAEAGSLKDQAAMATTDAVTRIMEVLADAEFRLRDAASKQILLEIALLKAIEARSAVSLDSVLKILQQLRNGDAVAATVGSRADVAANVSSRTHSPAVQPAKAVATQPPPTHVGGYDLATPSPVTALAETPGGPTDLEGLWARIVEAVGRASQFTKGYLVNAHPVSLATSVLTVGFDPEFEDYIGLVDNARNHELLQTKLRELGHAGVQVKFVKAESGVRPAPPAVTAPVAAPQPAQSPAPAANVAPPAAPAAKAKPAAVPASQDDFKNDPLIQKALEIFKGQLVNVRG